MCRYMLSFIIQHFSLQTLQNKAGPDEVNESLLTVW